MHKYNVQLKEEGIIWPECKHIEMTFYRHSEAVKFCKHLCLFHDSEVRLTEGDIKSNGKYFHPKNYE